MISWPKYPETINASDAIRFLLAFVIGSGWRFTPRPPPDYEGFDVGESTKATCPSPDIFLTLPNDGDPLGSTLARGLFVSFQLGCEQGRRLAYRDTQAAIDRLTAHLPEADRDVTQGAILDMIGNVARSKRPIRAAWEAFHVAWRTANEAEIRRAGLALYDSLRPLMEKP